MRILITGGAGYLGSVVLQKLQEDLTTNKISALICTDLKEVAKEKQLPKVAYEQADIRDLARLLALCEQYKPTVIIHLAAVIDSQSMPRALQYQIDVVGTKNVVEAALQTGVKRLIVSSSGAAYGYHADNPEWLRETDRLRGNEIFPYSDHKRLVEEMLATYRKDAPQLEQTIFRVGTILGASTDNLITQLFKKKRVLGLKGFASPFVFVWDEDVAQAICQAVYSPKTGIYNLAGDGAVVNKDLALILGKPYLALPPSLMRFLLRILHPIGLSQYGPEQLLFLQYRPVLDNSKLKTEFGFVPQKSSLETFLYYLEANRLPAHKVEKVELMMPF